MPIEEFKIGDQVESKFYGRGRVSQIRGIGLLKEYFCVFEHTSIWQDARDIRLAEPALKGSSK